jgi:plasmid stabilization system protein ParE
LKREAGQPVAAKYASALDAAYDRFASFPRIGPRRPALGAHARIWVVRPYVIVYDHIDDSVTVLRVLHGRRDITRRLIRPR